MLQFAYSLFDKLRLIVVKQLLKHRFVWQYWNCTVLELTQHVFSEVFEMGVPPFDDVLVLVPM